ncbi:MAG: alginate export family protein [Phycisphaeraceae bacterium]|nr:alginate export family protein [Phycisphaeraceae bacterium]
MSKRPPLGWLSDPKEPPNDIFDALVSGKIHFDNNFRVEFADSTARNSSTAITNRLRLGYETKPFYGFNGFVEMENVATPAEDNYFVPATGGGTSDRTVVADPPGTEVNQAFGRLKVDSLGNTGILFDLKAGRQRIKLDDDRFVGNVGWRQFEQTYDSVSVRTDFGVEGLSFFYAYVWGVQRIFGPDGPNPDSDSHFLNLSYRVAPELKVTPFAYLLDFEDDDPLNSSNSFGVRLTGDLWRDADDSADVYADYELTYARQVDAGSNPVDYEADFFAVQVRVTKKSVGDMLAGYQLLGSDDGNFGFRFPLGTNHVFQGFDDLFLVTPNEGLQDLYAGIGADLPHGIKAAFIFHQFWSDEGGTNLGSEYDMVASKQITAYWSILAKAAFFDGHNGQPDVSRVWLQTTFKF